jgi:hypothetical protein
MRGMRGKSESPVELAYYTVAAGRGSMDDPRMRPTNGLQGHEVIGGHTCIYADFDSFLAPGEMFFYPVVLNRRGGKSARAKEVCETCRFLKAASIGRHGYPVMKAVPQGLL